MERTYAGIPEENATLENAKVMLVTVPYDGTSTWGKGADKGPELFLDASENMELYDIETDTEPYLNGVYLEDIQETMALKSTMLTRSELNSEKILVN